MTLTSPLQELFNHSSTPRAILQLRYPPYTFLRQFQLQHKQASWLPFSTLQTVVTWFILCQKVPQASKYLCPTKQYACCDVRAICQALSPLIPSGLGSRRRRKTACKCRRHTVTVRSQPHEKQTTPGLIRSRFVCWLVAYRPSNMRVYLRDGSAQTILRATTLR